MRTVMIGSLVSVPFNYYKVFVLEEKYGFNKTTLSTFIKDILKQNFLAVIFIPLIYSGAVWIIDNTGDSFYFYLWMFGNGAIIVFMIIFPNFISPLFNKFTALGQEFDKFDADQLKKDGKTEAEIKGKFSQMSNLFRIENKA
jgi:STE24 endopeptidase